tara:strand:- start:382 stop:1062 length:681 start_codon:yes stop_codon:yes gene_type:complete
MNNFETENSLPQQGYWDRYKIGKISWVNDKWDHPHRQIFIDFALENINSVLEIGPGELIEYQIISKIKNIDYTIVDISNVFLKNCKLNFPEIKCFRSSMENLNKLGFRPQQFDIVYAASVFEHSSNIKRAIKLAMRYGKMFHFVFYKWSFGGSLDSQWNVKKKYYSSPFGIFLIIDEMKRYGTIDYANIIKRKSGDVIPFDEYKEGRKGRHRNGDYLVLRGQCFNA